MEEQRNNVPKQGWEEWDAASVLYFQKTGTPAVREHPEPQVQPQPQATPVTESVQEQPVERIPERQELRRTSLPDIYKSADNIKPAVFTFLYGYLCIVSDFLTKTTA